MSRPAFIISGHQVKPGEQLTIDLPAAQLYTHTPLNLPVVVIHGKKDGPVLLVTAAIHGDEINGVEIIRRLLKYKTLKRLRGTLILAPIVNIFGFIHRQRYLPDRRDLNRSFPGSPKGSLASRIAHIVKTELVDRASHIIDLHTGAVNRANLPQIRANMDSHSVSDFAHAFNTPVIIDSPLRQGSLRHVAFQDKKIVITYEAGEALRFEDSAISVGIKGILNCMRSIGMLTQSKVKAKKTHTPSVVNNSSWVRAPADGILRALVPLGASVIKNQKIGVVSDPIGDNEEAIKAPFDGIVIGRSNLPLVNEGEAFYHIARIKTGAKLEAKVQRYQDALDDDVELSGDISY